METGRFVDRASGRDRLAVVGSDRSFAWAAFATEVENWAAEAARFGAGADVPILIYGHKQASFLVAIAGCLSLGAPFVPVDDSYPDARFRQVVEAAHPSIVYNAGTGTFQPQERGRPLAEKGTAYLIFTSGSTGVPKGVQIGRESVGELARWMEEDFGLPPQPVFSNQAPFSFDLSMYETFGTLGLGGTCVLNSRDIARDSPAFAARARQFGAEVWVSTPSFVLQNFINREFRGEHLPTLRTFLFCGEVLSAGIAKELRSRFPKARILNTYGPTEATVATTIVEITDEVLRAHPVLPVGHAKKRSVIEINASTGEIDIIGNNVMRGYLNNPELNAATLGIVHGRRVFHTGDFGSMADDGLLFCHGRMDDQIKLNGYRVELGEIDAAARGLAGIDDAASIVLRRPDGTALRVVTYVVPRSASQGPGGEDGSWRSQLGTRLPAYMVPSELVFVDALPMTVNGKADRKAMLEHYLRRNSSA